MAMQNGPEAVPLWLISETKLGGLGMTEKEVGSLLSRSGLWRLGSVLALAMHMKSIEIY